MVSRTNCTVFVNIRILLELSGSFKDIIDYKIKVMKEMRVNAYRSSHHFASKELLEAAINMEFLS